MAYRRPPPPPESAVVDGEFSLGRFGAPFPRANFLDAAQAYGRKLPEFLRRLRLKEWQVFHFGDGRWCFSAGLYDGRLLSFVTFQAWDRKEKRRHAFERVFAGSRYRFGESLDRSQVACVGKRRSLAFEVAFGEGRMELSVARASRGGQPPFGGRFSFRCGGRVAGPSVACLPLGQNRAQYSTKILMPMQGEFEAGGERIAFSGPQAMGIFEDHKAYYPWTVRYDRVAAFGLDAKGRRVGFDLTDSQARETESLNANVLWIGTKVWALPPVRVTKALGPAGDWVIQDTEGLVDLVFSPEAPHDLHVGLGIVQADYHGPFGSFKGFVKNGEGEKIEAERLYGIGEQKYLRM